ncbi:DUF1572 family protein [Fimbriiglobus ruber]|uniref:DinB-like domain-containing protein n=1 Tax=Fimbriiglobus ruber TaxID=1908690 RepID=A0A225D3S8_9BACT|nr:DUF1572 family protein [Fimbriiglobus ruber]OWK36152.1 hypothetical protein FRUB_08715 [Fimbriiglobus ruber]
MSDLLADLTHEYRRHKDLADKSLAGLSDEAFFASPGEAVNPPAIIVKHLAGNFHSRWTDFLTTDGEKPTRDRDAEFQITTADTRPHLMADWEAAWTVLFVTLSVLTEADMGKTVPIRGEAHTVRQALLRGLTHTVYHIGQILYAARILNAQGDWLTIKPGASRESRPGYFKKPT